MGGTIQELHQVGTICPAHSAFNNLYGSRPLTINCRGLNKVLYSIHATVPNIATILDMLASILGVYHTVLDLENVFSAYP